MMKENFFHRLNLETPTRWWVNNPTLEEARLSLDSDAFACTTNPTYAIKMLKHPEMQALGRKILTDVISKESDDSLAASMIQRKLCELLMKCFQPLYEASGGTQGWVSIQGDPEKEDDPSEILREAEMNLQLGPNYIAKIPVTKSGIAAIAELSSNGVPIIATEIMSISQAVQVSEVYIDAVKHLKNPAPIYVTHITGIFDQNLAEWNQNNGLPVSDNVLRYAGFLVGRKQYGILKERKYPVIMLGGGARGQHHFTDFIGADMHITINWKGTADHLIETDPGVQNRFDTPIPDSLVQELLNRVPTFEKAWKEDRLGVEEYNTFPPVELFRSMFLAGWVELKTMIEEARFEREKE